MTTPDVTSMTNDELLAYQRQLTEKRQVLSDAGRAVQAEVDRRLAEAADAHRAIDESLGAITRPPTQEVFG